MVVPSSIAAPGKPVVRLIDGLDNGGVPVRITWPASSRAGPAISRSG
jgi:hypothetical protein